MVREGAHKGGISNSTCGTLSRFIFFQKPNGKVSVSDSIYIVYDIDISHMHNALITFCNNLKKKDYAHIFRLSCQWRPIDGTIDLPTEMQPLYGIKK